jgi:L-iditol 2-dehydrogenase
VFSPPHCALAGIYTLGPASRATVVGQAAPSVDGLPLAYLQRWEIDLVTAFRYAHAFPTAIAMAADGSVELASVITGRFPLDRTADALRAPGNDPRHLKVIVRPFGLP